MNVQMKKFTLALVSALSMGSAMYAVSDTKFDTFRDLTQLFDESNDLLEAMDVEASDFFPELQKLDQPFCYFKTTSKDPYMIKYNPASNQVQMITCGTQLPKCSARHTTKAEDLKNLAVLRSQIILSDANVQIDTKHEGYREQFVGRVAESLLISLGLLSDKPYSGRFMVDEYLSGMPMKWVLNSDKELTNLLQYLTSRLAELPEDASSKKPLLAIQLVKTGEQISMVNKALLDVLFVVVDQDDAAIKPYYDEIRAFYQKSQSALNDALSKYGKDTPVVKQSFGEMMFGAIEKQTKEFKIKDVIAAALGAWIAAEATKKAKAFFNNECAKPTAEFLKEKEADHKEYFRYAANSACGLAAFVVFYAALKVILKDEYEKSVAAKQALANEIALQEEPLAENYELEEVAA